MADTAERHKLNPTVLDDGEEEPQVSLPNKRRAEREQELAKDESLNKMTDGLVTAFFIALAIKILSYLYNLKMGTDSEL